jgi:hypothetical protein
MINVGKYAYKIVTGRLIGFLVFILAKIQTLL